MRVIVELPKGIKDGWTNTGEIQWPQENIIEVERKNLLFITEKICQQCRYPLLTLRLLLHIICGIDANGQVHISARQLSKKLDAHYNTVTKCLKYLREIGVVRIKR